MIAGRVEPDVEAHAQHQRSTIMKIAATVSPGSSFGGLIMIS
jgi:hypothetical protein